MVSLNEADTNTVVQPAHAEEDSFGEQYFPREMSWYAAEGPQGLIEAGARKVRENPWAAVGIALAAGVALALIGGPLLRAGVRGVQLAATLGKKAEAEAEEARDDAAGEGERLGEELLD